MFLCILLDSNLMVWIACLPAFEEIYSWWQSEEGLNQKSRWAPCRSMGWSFSKEVQKQQGGLANTFGKSVKWMGFHLAHKWVPSTQDCASWDGQMEG